MDLPEQSKLFCTGNRLKSVATGLGKLIVGKAINEEETNNFKWVSNLVEQMDLNYGHYSPDKHPELKETAMRLRSSFYRNFHGNIPYFNELFREVSDALKLLAVNGRANSKFSRLGDYSQLFQGMASDIFVYLQCQYRMGQI